jgi:hypothetical protein
MNEQSIRCPHCQTLVEREASGKQPIPGSPFRRCPNCGRLYYDEAYEDPALTLFGEKQPRFNFVKILYAAVPTAGALIYLKAWLDGTNSVGNVFALVFGAIAVFFLVVLTLEIVGFFKRRKEHLVHRALLSGRGGALSRELAESMERLRDGKYLDALESCGVEVPGFFRDAAREEDTPQAQ